MLIEGYVAVFLLGLLAGGLLTHLAYRPLVREAHTAVAHWKRVAAGWEERSVMQAALLNAFVRAGRDIATGEDAPPPRLTVVEK